MLSLAGVKTRQYAPPAQIVEIDFLKCSKDPTIKFPPPNLDAVSGAKKSQCTRTPDEALASAGERSHFGHSKLRPQAAIQLLTAFMLGTVCALVLPTFRRRRQVS